MNIALEQSIFAPRFKASSGPSPDADVSAWVGRVIAAGATISQPAIDLYTAFSAGMKADGTWGFIKDMAVFMGPSTLEGALCKLKFATNNALANTNYLSGDYAYNAGLQGGTSKRLDVRETVYSATDPNNNNALVGFEGSSISANTILISDGSTSSFRTGICSNPSGLLLKCLATGTFAGATLATYNAAPSLILETRSNTTNFYYRFNGSESSFTTGVSFTGSYPYYVGGSSSGTSSYLGIIRGYMIGAFAGGTETHRANISSRWATLINGLKAL